MTRVKLAPLHEPTLNTAHDVRHLVGCAGCGNLMDDRQALRATIDSPNATHWHGRCFVDAFGLRVFLALPFEQTQHLTLGDIGVDNMRALLNRDPATTGAKGGKAKGPRKARDAKHYARLAELRRARVRWLWSVAQTTRPDAGGPLYIPVRYIGGKREEYDVTPSHDRDVMQAFVDQLNARAEALKAT